MYSLKVPYKTLFDKPGNRTVYFNLFEIEVFKLLPELQYIFEWIESQQKGEAREVPTEEVVKFYTAFEELILESYGTPSEDGIEFDKSDKYSFGSSVIFNAVMVMMISDPNLVSQMLDGLMPKDLQEIAKKADANLSEMAKKEDNPAALQAEIERLRAQLPADPSQGQPQQSSQS